MQDCRRAGKNQESNSHTVRDESDISYSAEPQRRADILLTLNVSPMKVDNFFTIGVG